MQARINFNLPGRPPGPVELPTFDRQYIEQLGAGTADIQEHFANYFVGLLNAVLRNRLRCPDLINDVRQETITRVLTCIQLGQVQHPERFRSFVLGVCRRVLFEYWRREMHNFLSQGEHEDLIYGGADPHEEAVTNERRTWILRVLELLPSKDRRVLKMLYLDGINRSEVCISLGIRPDNFCVVLHRAKSRLHKRLALPSDASKSLKAIHSLSKKELARFS